VFILFYLIQQTIQKHSHKRLSLIDNKDGYLKFGLYECVNDG
jgi:hypothetical protein